MLRRVVVLVATLFTLSTLVNADPYPPYWQNGSGAAVHFAPVAWPSAWTPYTSQGRPIADRRDADQSNGGTSPQGYVNVTSGCTDTSSPSIYHAYDATAQVMFFRWRVQAPPHNYATGPSPGSFSSSNPWQSALWTVMIDLNGDGFRDFAVHLDGSSGSPAVAVDRLAAIYSRTLTHSLDYIGDPNVTLVRHNPTAFVDQATSRILNFQNSLTPTPNWLNGSSETTWDYGTTRATLLSSGCGEYFIDYQIPLAMLDATAVGGPALTPSTPMSLFFTTSNSLTNPLQKDAVTSDAFVAGTGPLPFGDVITPAGGTYQQPLILADVRIGACGAATTLSASAMDVRTPAGSTVQALDFFRYADLDANGLADDAGTWQALAVGTPVASGSNTFAATVNFTTLASGQYLIGARATDTSTPANNVTWGFYSTSDLVGASLATPPNFANPSPTPGILATRYVNSCGSIPLTMTSAVSPSSASTGDPVTLTVTVTNGGSTPLDVSTITVPLPTGFTFAGSVGGSLGTPGTQPTGGAAGSISFGAFATPTIAGGGSATLSFVMTTSSTPGAYALQPAGITTAGAVTSNVVAVALGAPSVIVSASASTAIVTPGTPFTVTASYVNTGTASATNGALAMTIPAGFTYQSSTNSGVWDPGARTVTWPVGTLAGLGGGQQTVTLVPDAPYSGGGTPAFPVAFTADGLTANASASVAVNAPGTALGVDLAIADPNVAAGASVPIRIHYANASAVSASNAQLTLAIPSGFAFASATDGGTHGSGTVTWTLGTLAGSATGYVDVTVTASSPWTGLLNPASFLATLSATSASSATDTQAVGVNYGVGSTVCSTYYFQSTAFTNGTAGTTGYLATAVAPAATSPTTIQLNVTTAPQFVGRFFQGPAAATDVRFAGTLTTYFYISKVSGPQLKLDAYVYDFNPADNSKTLLGQASFTKTGGGDNVLYDFVVNVSGTLAKDHRLLWEFDAYSNNSTTFTFNFASTNPSVPLNNSPSRAAYCVAPPATPVIDHDVSPLLGAEGAGLVYLTHFGNIGLTDMTGSTIDIAIPDGVTATGAQLNGATVTLPTPISAGGVSTYTIAANTSDTATAGQVTGGQSGVIRLTATLDGPSSPLVATATLLSAETAGIADGATVRLVRPSLTTSVTSNTALAAPGDVVTYTAVVTNTGAVTASGLTLSTALPVTATYTYVADSPTLGGSAVVGEAFASPDLGIPMGSLAAGTSVTVTWQMRVNPTGVPAGTTAHALTASVADSGSATATSNPVTVTIVNVPALDVQITAAAPHSPAQAGDIVTVTATVTSTGGATASGVTFNGPILASGTYVSGSLALVSGPGAGPLTDVADVDAGTFTGGGNAVSVVLGDLDPAEVRVIQWQVRLDATLQAGPSTISGTGSVVSGNAGVRTGNYSVPVTAATAMTTVLSAPASLSLPVASITGQTSGTEVTVPTGTPVVVGDVVSVNGTIVTVTAFDGTTVLLSAPVTAGPGVPMLPTVPYVVTCSNGGTATATHVSIIFTLPTSTTLVSATAPYTGGSPTVTWAIGTLAPGDTATREVRVLAPSAADLTGTASCELAEGSPVQAQAQTALGAVVLTKTTTSATPVAGASGLEATYTITARNQRSSAATGVIITDALAPGITYLAPISITGATPTSAPVAGDRDLQWSGFAVPAGSDVVITFSVSLANLSPGTYQNMAAGTSANSAVLPYDETSSTAEDVIVAAPLGNTAAVDITAVSTSATITLADIDLDTDATTAQTIQVVVTNVATGEQETVTITETGPATGVFSGPLPVVAVAGPGPSNNGTMMALAGQELHVSYLDTLTGLGTSVTVSDSAVLPGSPVPPVLTATAGVVTFAQGDGPKVVDAGIVVTAGTSATIASATIGVCSGFVSGQDVLAFTPLHGVTGSFDATAGILSLAGTATVAQWQEVLRTVTYAHAATPSAGGPRGVCVGVSDGMQSSNTVTRTVDVIASAPSTMAYYLTEGAKNAFLRTRVFIANPTGTAANVQVELYSGLGERHSFTFLLAANSRQTYDLADFAAQITDTAVSTVVTSLDRVPLLVEREVEWGTNGYGAHAEQAATELSTRLYFAEGAKAPFSPYLVVLNPGSQDAQLMMQFLNADGSAVDSVALVARAGHRETFDLRVIAAAASQAFGMVLESTQPIAAEHAMYMGDTQTWAIGHGGGSTVAPATRWYFSEGTTYLDWETFLLFANPGTAPAAVTVQYHVENGPTITRTYAVGAGQRFTVNVGNEDPALAYDHFWTEVSSDQPIVAERSMYWVKPWTQWTEAHSSPAMAAPQLEWGFAHGREGLAGHANTYLLFANPNNQPNSVTLRVVTASGERTSSIVIPANDRVSYHVGIENPLVENTEFWMYLQSSSQLPFLVERSLYWSADGQTWTTGTNITGIKVTLPQGVPSVVR